jgi:6-phosphofructokinase 1
MEPQSAQIRTIGITTGGGDCPGLNAVIRAVVLSAVQRHGWRVIGIPDGFEGLVSAESGPRRCRPLTLEDVRDILPRGGTILGTTNRHNPFSYRVRENGCETVRDVSDQVIKNAQALGLDALIVVGGDGTQKIGLGLFDKGLPVVGVPKTIDNDLCATDSTFGFDSAVHVATEAVDRLHTTAESHHRIMLLEVMGRNAGWIALHAGLAGGAHAILIPEIPFSIEKLCAFLQRRDDEGNKYSIIVVAEGVQLKEELVALRAARGTHDTVSSCIASAISRRTDHEVRVTVLGHTQRGGSPSPPDRILSSRFGVAVVELVARGEFGHMVALRGSEIVSVPLHEACARMKSVDPDSDLLRVARTLGVSFGAT